jgi:copper homeostasis protein
LSAKRFIEIACFSKEAAIIAAEAGAHRIEICKDKTQDGLSVSLNELEDLLRSVNIPVHVMVRPRGGNFCVFCRRIFMDARVYVKGK